MLTVRIVDFILRLDFTDILKVAAQQEKRTVWVWSTCFFALLFSYLLLSTFDTYLPGVKHL